MSWWDDFTNFVVGTAQNAINTIGGVPEDVAKGITTPRVQALAPTSTVTPQVNGEVQASGISIPRSTTRQNLAMQSEINMAAGVNAFNVGGEIAMTPYRAAIAEPFSALLLSATTGKSIPDAYGLARGDTSKKRWYEGGEGAVSLGQSVYGFAGLVAPGQQEVDKIDWTNSKEVKSFFDKGPQKWVSGGVDAAATVFLDPLIVGGKFAKVLRIASFVRPVKTAEDVAYHVSQIDNALAGGDSVWSPFFNYVKENADNESAIIARSNIFEAPAADDLSASLAKAMREGDTQLAGDITKYAIGESAAGDRLLERRDIISAKVAKLKLREQELIDGVIADPNEELLQVVRDGISKAISEDASIYRVVGSGDVSQGALGSMANRTVSKWRGVEELRNTIAKQRSQTMFEQQTVSVQGLPVKVLTWLNPSGPIKEMPSGIFNIGNFGKDSTWKELLAQARHAGKITGRDYQQTLNQYLRLGTKEERALYLSDLEKTFVEDTINKLVIDARVPNRTLSAEEELLVNTQREAARILAESMIESKQLLATKVWGRIRDNNYVIFDGTGDPVVVKMLEDMISAKAAAENITPKQVIDALASETQFGSQAASIYTFMDVLQYGNVIKENASVFRSMLEHIEGQIDVMSALTPAQRKANIKAYINELVKNKGAYATKPEQAAQWARWGYDSLITGLDLFHATIWKPLTLISLKYGVRNVLEGTGRAIVAMDELSSLSGNSTWTTYGDYLNNPVKALSDVVKNAQKARAARSVHANAERLSPEKKLAAQNLDGLVANSTSNLNKVLSELRSRAERIATLKDKEGKLQQQIDEWSTPERTQAPDVVYETISSKPTITPKAVKNEIVTKAKIDTSTLEGKIQVMSDEVKKLNPNFKGSTDYVALVKTKFIDSIKEFDRLSPEQSLGGVDRSKGIIDGIVKDLKSGAGFDNEFIVAYDVESNSAKLIEGNHRLQAAKIAGLEYVPVRITRAYKSEVDSLIKLPGEAKATYVGSSTNPIEILPDNVIKKVAAKTVTERVVVDKLPGLISRIKAQEARRFVVMLLDGDVDSALKIINNSQDISTLTKGLADFRDELEVLGKSFEDSLTSGKYSNYLGSHAVEMIKKYQDALYDATVAIDNVIASRVNAAAAWEDFNLLTVGATPMLRAKGDGTFLVEGVHMPDFGKDQLGMFALRESSADKNFANTILAGNRLIGENVFTRGVRNAAIEPTNANWSQAYRDFINGDVRSDEVLYSILQGKKDEEIAKYVASTEARGYRIAVGLGERPKTSEIMNHLQWQRAKMALYIPEVEGLAPGWLKNQILAGEIDDAIVNSIPQTQRMTIAGDDIAKASRANLWNVYNQFVQKVFKYVGTIPETGLARHPFYRAAYRGEVRRLSRILKAQGRDLNSAQVQDSIQRAAHRRAFKALNETMYTIERRSDPAQLFRFLSPFYMAQQNSARFWIGAAVKNPALAQIGTLAWNVPNKMFDVVDENGNSIEFSLPFKANEKILLNLPESWAKNLTGADKISFSKSSMDLIFQGQIPLLPSLSGPLVSVAASQLIDVPEISAKLTEMGFDGNWIEANVLPYFDPTRENLVEQISPMPAWVKSFVNASGRTQQYAARANLIYEQMQMEAILNNVKLTPEKYAKMVSEAHNRAAWSYVLEGTFAITSPVSTKVTTDQQLLHQEYRRYIQRYGNIDGPIKAASEMGNIKSVFASSSLSLNRAGLLATPQTQRNLKNNMKLAETIQTMGDDAFLMLGTLFNEGSPNDYSQAVNQYFYDTSINGQPIKEQNTNLTAAAKKREASAGWSYWVPLKQIIVADAEAKGIKIGTKAWNTYYKPGLDAVALKLETMFPGWKDARANVNKDKGVKYFTAIKYAVNDQGYMNGTGKNRPIVQALKKWVQFRDAIAIALAQRSSKDILANSNSDIVDAMDRYASSLSSVYPEFANVYERYLSRDSLEIVE